MKIHTTRLPEVLLLEPKMFGDDRGFFFERYNSERYTEVGITDEFVQDNHSRSRQGVIRGLHFQKRQGKLVSVVRGEVFDVAVDVRPDSDTFGQWTGATLSEENHHQLWVPAGFAHGFAVISESADVLYKTTDFYRPEEEGAIRWNDADVGVEWPFGDPILSDRDQNSPFLRDLPREGLITRAELSA